MRYSVIMPCYNAVATLERAVSCIRNCGLTDFEILLIDDGSSDGTAVLCDRLAESTNGVRCIHKENGGVSSARNLGIQEAIGEYLWFFDADDTVNTGSLKYTDQIVNEHYPDVLMFGMSFDYYSGKRMYQSYELYYDKEMLMCQRDFETLFSELYHNNMLTPCWNKIIKRKILIDNNIRFHLGMIIMEDFLFSLKTLQSCETIYTLPQAIYHYIQGNDQDLNRAAKRLKRIPDLSVYLEPFEEPLAKYPEILNGMFFTLLRQKMSIQSPKEIRETVLTVLGSRYARSEKNAERDTKLINTLQEGKYNELYRRIQRNRRRVLLKGFVKRSHLFSIIRGNPVKKITL